MEAKTGFSLMIHGGAGTMSEIKNDTDASAYLDAVRRILENGRRILASGGQALQAVETCAAQLEDDPLFNAGRGSVLNNNGQVEMDAAIMDGRDLDAGAVAAVCNIANPIRLARLVMEKSNHVMLIGPGAMDFAAGQGVELKPLDYFITPQRHRQYLQARQKNTIVLDHDSDDDKLGTIGAIARDLDGNLAAATSTGGITNKHSGRVGDTPIIGAGVYADNQTCAVSCTGHGEEFMRTVIAKTIADYIEMKGFDGRQATAAGIEYLKKRVKGRGGLIVIDNNGTCCCGFTTPKMIHGWIELGGETQARIWP